MDIYNLDTHLLFINQVGCTLSTDEKIRLTLALQQVGAQVRHDEVKFWGKIEGQKRDYFLALALDYKDKYLFPTKTFYYAGNNLVFKPLPALMLEYAQQVEQFRQPFLGEPEHVLIAVQADEEPEKQEAGDEEEKEQKPVEEENSDDDEKIKVMKRPFLEVDRLSYTVQAIENDCQVVPKGAVKMTPAHQLRPDSAFQGVSAPCLSSFQHFRAPQSQDKQSAMAQPEVIFSDDFLDCLSMDHPQGCWSVQQCRGSVTLRSYVWNGYVGYCGGAVWGGAYFGNGLKNSDLPFMLNKY